MSFDEKSPQTGGAAHRIVLDNRNRLTVSGVDGVESFDETSIVMSTAEGSLIIRKIKSGRRGPAGGGYGGLLNL